MTAIFVFAALIIASVAYSVFDGRRAEAARRMDDFYRVEFKKSYVVKDEIAAQNCIDRLQNEETDGFGYPFFCAENAQIRDLCGSLPT